MATELISALDHIVRRYMDAIDWFSYSDQHLTRQGAQIYVMQHGVFTRESRRHWAYVVGNCPHIEVRRFIERENLYEEEGIEEESHFLKLVRMGEAVGLTHREVEEALPLPTTRTALWVWECLTKNRPWWVGLAAKAVLERTNAPQCGNMSAAEGERWKRQLGLSPHALEFWIMHDEIDQIHGSGAYDALVQNVKSAEQEREILQAAEDSMAAWKWWLDGVAKAAQLSDSTVGR